MTTTKIRHRITGENRGVSAPLRESQFGSEGEAKARNPDAWQEGFVRPQNAAESHGVGIGQIIGNKCDVNSIQPQASFVDHRWIENVCLAESKHLTMPLARISESRNSGACSGFMTQIVLVGVKAVQLVRGAEIVIDIQRGLVNVHGRRRRSKKRGPSVEGSIGWGNQSQQRVSDSIAGTLNLRSLCV